MTIATNTALIVTVDTEEDGAWNGGYSRNGHTVENIRHIDRFQQLCRRYQLHPTYLVDAPVVEDSHSVNLLRAILEAGECEIGAHLHPWCTFPFVEDNGARSSFLCNLPKHVQREKLLWMTDAIENRFGHRPTSFRAGRYGLDIVGAGILRDLHYRVDSSVIPFSDYSDEEGPNFSNAPCFPYFIGRDELCEPSGEPSLVEMPLSVGFSRPDFDRAAAARRTASRPWLRSMHAVGILDRLGIARRIKFSPEQSDARRLRQLVDAFLTRGIPAMVMSLHSSSLCPGGSPYVRTADELERLYRTLEETFEYCRSKQMKSATLTEFADAWSNHAA